MGFVVSKFQVRETTEGDIVSDIITAAEVAVITEVELNDPNPLPTVSPGARAWIPFYVTMPPEKTLKMDVRRGKTRRIHWDLF